GDADDYLRLYRYDDSTLRLTGLFNGTTVNADYATPTLNAGTTYEIKITYTSGGSLVLYVDGVSRATNTGVVAFGTAPATAYFGSDNTGLNQYDATFTEPAFGGSATATENTTAPYYKFGSKSLKLVASADSQYVTSVNPGNTNTHTLSAYVYDGTTGNVGGTVDSSVIKLVYGSSVVTPYYTDQGGGWWRLTYSAATVNAAGDYGIAVLSGKTVYVDGVQLEEKAYATTYADGTLGTGYSWSGTANESTGVRAGETLKFNPTNNINTASGSLSFWVKSNYSGNLPSVSERWIRIGEQTGTSHFWIYSFDSIYAEFRDTSGNTVTSNKSGGIVSGNWYHVVATWNTSGGNLTPVLYVNNITGTNSGSSTGWDYTQNGGDQNIYISGDTQANSVISDFRTYSSALTSTEVSDLYYSGLGTHQQQTQPAERFTGSGEPPVLNWKMTEGYGTTAYDSSIQQNNGTINGAVWDTAIAPPSSSGEYKSLNFDGSNDFVSRTYSSDTELNPKTDDFTVGTWFRHGNTVTSNQYLVTRYNTSGYKMWMNSSGFICFGIDDDSTWGPDDSACTTTFYADSSWHYAQASKTSSSITLYIDGVQKA
ncbi:hypothetical protein COY32_06295, partial [candidate division WWE3 bacterium CG_4_10_14_0_2_um_filter_41_14]